MSPHGELMSAPLWTTVWTAVRSTERGNVVIAAPVRLFIPFAPNWRLSGLTGSHSVGVGNFAFSPCTKSAQGVVTNVQRCNAQPQAKNQIFGVQARCDGWLFPEPSTGLSHFFILSDPPRIIYNLLS